MDAYRAFLPQYGGMYVLRVGVEQASIIRKVLTFP